MNSKTVRCLPAALLFPFALAFALIAAAPAAGGDKPPVRDGQSPSAAADSIAEAQLREEEGQDFSSLFDGTEDGLTGVDTNFAWSNDKINSGRFDYKALGPQDTIKIALVDSSQNRSYVHPFNNRVTSPFGPRKYLWHYGTDVKLNKGDTVRCATDGIVRVIQFDRRGYGNVAVVRHHSGLETLYGHLYKVKVELNQKIKAGEMVGLGGNTGRSTGAHLHFEFRYFGEPFEPSYIIDFENYVLKNDTLVLTRDNFEYLTELRKTVYHTVRRGDNLGAIARRYGTTVNKLCRLNGITAKTTLRVGQKLVARSGKEAEEQVQQTSAGANANAVDSASPAAPVVLVPTQVPADALAGDAAGGAVNAAGADGE